MGLFSSCGWKLWFLLSFSGYLGKPLELHKDDKASF